jgi:hypothetical protein
MLVEGYVNGQGPFRFLVDSGATSTVLSNDLFNSLKIPVLSTAVVSCVGGTGKTGTKLAKVEKLKVGELEISNLPISSFDNTIFAELIDGVLSTADLADFLITLDYPDRRILLAPRPSKPVAKPSTDVLASRVEIPFRILGNLILAPISINQQPAQSFLLTPVQSPARFQNGRLGSWASVTIRLTPALTFSLPVHVESPNPFCPWIVSTSACKV